MSVELDVSRTPAKYHCQSYGWAPGCHHVPAGAASGVSGRGHGDEAEDRQECYNEADGKALEQCVLLIVPGLVGAPGIRRTDNLNPMGHFCETGTGKAKGARAVRVPHTPRVRTATPGSHHIRWPANHRSALVSRSANSPSGTWVKSGTRVALRVDRRHNRLSPYRGVQERWWC